MWEGNMSVCVRTLACTIKHCCCCRIMYPAFVCVCVCVCVCVRLFMLNQYNMQELFPLLVRLMLHLSIRGRHAIQ